jgi:hypothetical protein
LAPRKKLRSLAVNVKPETPVIKARAVIDAD